MNKKVTFLLVWLLVLSLGSLIVISNTDFAYVATNRILITNIIQRILGLTAFYLITFQIILGGNMDFFRKKFGSFALNFHKFNGMIAYTFIFLHPAMWIVWNYFLRGNIDPYYPFIDLCGLCKPAPYEYFVNLGRFGFWTITLAVAAARLVTWVDNKWLRYNWRKIHILNYLAFYFVSVHAFFVGSDNTGPKFLIPFIIAQILVAWTIWKKVRGLNVRELYSKILQ